MRNQYTLEQTFVQEEVSYALLLEKCKSQNEIKYFLGTLFHPKFTFSLYSLFVKKDVNEAKSHFYSIGRLFEFSLTKPADSHFPNYYYLGCGLLSDNQALISRLSYLYHPDYEYLFRNGEGFVFQSIQFIIKNDMDSLQKMVERLDSKMLPLKKWEFARWDREIFVGFLTNDKIKIENTLQEMLVPKIHKSRTKHQWYSDYISFPALGYAKLAWIKGMEVEVNNPLIPKELLPVQPLAAYPEYEFILEAEAQAKTDHVK